MKLTKEIWNELTTAYFEVHEDDRLNQTISAGDSIAEATTILNDLANYYKIQIANNQRRLKTVEYLLGTCVFDD